MHSPAPRSSPLRVAAAADGGPYPPAVDGVADSLVRRIRVICGTSFDAMLVVDAERRFRRLNDSAIDLLGSSREAILRSRIDDFTPSAAIPEMVEMWAEFSREGSLAGSYEVQRGDGSRSLVEFRARTGFDNGEHLIVARPLPETGDRRTAEEERPLTRREREVLQLAADGRSVRDIADELYVSVGTIKTHFQHIHSKLGVSNRAAAVASALRLGLID